MISSDFFLQLSPSLVSLIRGVHRPAISDWLHHPRHCRRDNLSLFRFTVCPVRLPRLPAASRSPFRLSSRWAGRLDGSIARYIAATR